MNTPSNKCPQWVADTMSVISGIAYVGLRGLIRCYQVIVSPLIQPRCRYHPSCSHYAMDALQTHGLFRGSILALKRLARCHPWSKGGVDLVPKPNADETSY